MSDEPIGSYGRPERRWAGVGPYYAMFPTEFSDTVVTRYTKPGDAVLDPFAGRGTSVYSAATHERIGLGIELNAVGWIYGRTKLHPADGDAVRLRLRKVGKRLYRYADEARKLPAFFHVAFSREVRRFLCASRQELDWRRNRVDRTLMALLLVNLHGKREASFSNQMRQTKAMSPQYAVRWWAERQLTPPEIDPVAFMEKRIDWRYAKGLPTIVRGRMLLGDSTRLLTKLGRDVAEGSIPRPKLLFTSPPYWGVTNYHYDQWIRLWLLGGAPGAERQGGVHRDKFESHERYEALLQSVFTKSAGLLHRRATIYVRTDKRKFTLETTRAALKSAFPRHSLRAYTRPAGSSTQTALFANDAGTGDVDLVLTRSD